MQNKYFFIYQDMLICQAQMTGNFEDLTDCKYCCESTCDI